MKRTFTLCVSALLCCLQVLAQSVVEVGDFKVQLNADKTAKILEYLVKDGEYDDADIPATVLYYDETLESDVEYSVKGVAGAAFDGTNIKVVKVGENVVDKFPYTFYLENGKVQYSMPASAGNDYFVGDAVIPAAVSFMDTTFAMQLYMDMFAGCENLTSVTFSEGITEVPEYVFRTDIPNLTAVKYPTTLQKLGVQEFGENYEPNYTEYGNAVYMGVDGNPHFLLVKAVNADITTCNIHDDTKVIAARAFDGCTDLTAVTIPAGISKDGLGDYAFTGCHSLVSIKVPAAITKLSNGAFSFCNNLVDVELPETLTEIGEYAFSSCGFEAIAIPESVTKIGKSAFEGCGKLKSVTIPAGVTMIADWTFDNCGELYDVNLPKGLTTIGENAFSGTRNLTKIAIPDMVSRIEGAAFSRSSLMEVTLPKSLNMIGADAFRFCQFDTLNIPSVETIGDFAFSECDKLKSISLPEGLKSIGRGAFNACINLRKVTIPASVSSIYYDIENNDNQTVFNDCYNLQYIEFAGATNDSKAFHPIDNYDVTIVVPAGTKQAFVDSKLNETYPNIVDSVPALIPEIYTEKFGLRFLLNPSKRTATLVWGETDLSAFYITTPELNEENITIPASINYNGLEYIVTKIGNAALRGVFSTDTLTIPATVTEIGYKSIADCGAKKVVLPKSIAHIGSLCFMEYDEPINLHASVPPTVNANSVNTRPWVDKGQFMTVNVPKKSMETYKTTRYWDQCTILQLDQFFTVSDTNNVGNYKINGIDQHHYQEGETVSFWIAPNDSYEFDSIKIIRGTVPLDMNLKVNSFKFAVEDTVVFEVILKEKCHIEVIPTFTKTTCFGQSDGAISLAFADSVEYVWFDRPDHKQRELKDIPSGVYEVQFTKGECVLTKSFELKDGNPKMQVVFDEKLPTCNLSDGAIIVKASKETFKYNWNIGKTTKDITDIPAGYYEVIVTDPETNCQITEWTIINPADAPEIIVENVIPTACDTNAGAITISVNKEIEKFQWSNEDTTQNVSNLVAGFYTVTATDKNKCQVTQRIEVPQRGYEVPQISLVTVSQETGKNLVVWQRENTDLIDFYTVYREREDQPGIFVEAGTKPYAETPVFEDTLVDPSKQPYVYRISATNACKQESPRSELNSSLHVKVVSTKEMSDVDPDFYFYTCEVTWTPYDGVDFSEYVLYRRVVINGVATDTEVGTYGKDDEMMYRGQVPEEGHVYYYIGVRLKKEFDANATYASGLRSGDAATKFDMALSNLAKAENGLDSAVDDISISDFVIYVEDKTIVCNTDFVIFNVAGLNVSRLNGNLPAGVYLVSTPFGTKTVVVKP